jgi:hypothetical protein
MEPAPVRTALARIGFLEAVTQAFTDEQGIDSLEEIRLLSDDEISNLAKLLRRPGGVVPGQVNAAGNAVPNPGIQVNARAETNLKLVAFYLRHQVRIGRTVTPADVTLENIRSIRELRDYEGTWKASNDTPVINAKDWPKTMEAIHGYLRSYLGDKMIPLAYVVRKDEAVPTVEPEGGYTTVQDEMIARAPHFRISATGVRNPDPTFLVNRQKVWEIIAHITRENSCWTYVKDAQRTRDGRKAYLLLWTHYLGPNNVDNMATQAEQKRAIRPMLTFRRSRSIAVTNASATKLKTAIIQRRNTLHRPRRRRRIWLRNVRNVAIPLGQRTAKPVRTRSPSLASPNPRRWPRTLGH